MSCTKTVKNKFSLSYFIWMGCNAVVSITFIGTFSSLSNIGQTDSIGINAIWVMTLVGIVVAICAYACAKLVCVHKCHNNGGIYIFIRAAFGKFWGFFVAFIQYVILPFLIAFQIMMLLRGTFTPEWVATKDASGNITNIPWYAFNLGSFSDLWLDLIWILVYIIFSFVIFGGMKFYKKIINGTAIIKFITAGMLILAGIYLAFQHGGENLSYWKNNSHLSLNGFVKSFNSCFYFFTGFEIVTRAGHNVDSPQKNMGKGLMWILLINIISHIVIAIIFFAAFSSFAQNMNMGTWNAFHNKVIIYGGTIIMIFFVISLKINLIIQDSLYGSATLQPLATEGFFTEKIKYLNKDGLATKAAFMHVGLTIISLFIWLIIPDLIKGIILTHKFGFMCTINQALTYKEPFDVGSLTAASSTITILVYLMMFAALWKLIIIKKIKLRVWELIVFSGTMFILLFMFIWHYYSLINGILSTTGAIKTSNIIRAGIEIIFMGSVSLFVVIWYFTYYKHKFNCRMKTNPEIQRKLDFEFEIIDNWKLLIKFQPNGKQSINLNQINKNKNNIINDEVSQDEEQKFKQNDS